MHIQPHVRIRLLALALLLVAPIAAWSADSSATDNTTQPIPVRLIPSRIRFLAADSMAHYRFVDSAPGKVTARDLYYKLSTRVQINLTGDGTTYLQARGESGRSFQGSFDYTGMGMHDGYWSFNLKSLFLAQRIGEHFDAQAGGIEFDRGAGTEATYADNDGWLEGYRLTYSGNAHGVLPDRINLSVGYVGDFLQPNVFARLSRMGEENYIQILASRKLGPNRDLSVEFDSIQTIRYTRQAFHWQKIPLHFIDEGYVEATTRASDGARFGWSSNLFKGLDRQRRVRIGAFYSDMPNPIFRRGKNVIFLNGDSYVCGKRIGPTLRWTLPQNIEVSLFGSRRLDETPGPRYRFHATIRYGFSNLLNRLLM